MNKFTHKIEFTFGIGLDKDFRRIPREVAVVQLECIRTAALDLFGGCTQITGTGAWRDDEFMANGRTWVEDNCTLVVLTDLEWNRSAVAILAERIKVLLDQAAVLVTYPHITGEML